MDVIAVLTLFFLAVGLGVYLTTEYHRLRTPEREQALIKQVHALQTSLEISQRAWEARVHMHSEAELLRRDPPDVA